MLASVEALIHNASHLKDYFGNGPFYVPLGSLESYETALDAALQNLKDIEPAYQGYQADLNNMANERNHLQVSLKHGKDMTKEIDKQIDNTRSELKKVSADAAALDYSANQKKEVLADAMHDFSKAITDQLNFPSADDSINALGSLAFFPEGSTSHDHNTNVTTTTNPAFQQMSMVASVVGDLGKSTFSMVTTDSGEEVDKSLIVQKLDVFSRDMDSLAEGYKVSAYGINFDDKDAYKLMITQQDFDRVCDDFYHTLDDARHAREAMDDYVNEVKARNDAILMYNEGVSRWYDLQGKKAMVETQIKQCEGQLADASQPFLADMTLFMENLYNHAKDQCINLLYNASRALTLWSLKDYDAFYETLGLSDRLAINSSVIESGRTDIIVKRMTDIALPKQPFCTGCGESGTGIIKIFDSTNAPDLIASLKAAREEDSGHKVYTIEFPLAPVTYATSRDESPFAGLANIRLVKIRCWIHGMKTEDGVHEINITRSGDDSFVAADDTQGNVTTFQHAPFPRVFKYDASQGEGNPDAISIDGCLLDKDEPLKSYTPIGPFTRKWRISVHEKNHKGLDMSGVDKVTMEFHGKAVGFTADI